MTKTPTLDFSLIQIPGSETLDFSYQGTGINNAGTIVGTYGDVRDTVKTSFLLEAGLISTISFPDAENTFVKDINNKGEIVGQYTDKHGQIHGFLLYMAKYKTLDFPNSIGTVIEGISNNGSIAGLYLDSNGVIHGFYKIQGGNFTTLDHPKAKSTYITGINNKGLVVGDYAYSGNDYRSFYYFDGKFIDFDFPGAVSTFVVDINNSDKMVGVYLDKPGNTGLSGHGYIHDIKKGVSVLVDYPTAYATLLSGIAESDLMTGFASWQVTGCGGKNAITVNVL